MVFYIIYWFGIKSFPWVILQGDFFQNLTKILCLKPINIWRRLYEWQFLLQRRFFNSDSSAVVTLIAFWSSSASLILSVFTFSASLPILLHSFNFSQSCRSYILSIKFASMLLFYFCTYFSENFLEFTVNLFKMYTLISARYFLVFFLMN